MFLLIGTRGANFDAAGSDESPIRTFVYFFSPRRQVSLETVIKNNGYQNSGYTSLMRADVAIKRLVGHFCEKHCRHALKTLRSSGIDIALKGTEMSQRRARSSNMTDNAELSALS